jgi:ABC-type lipoprotein release transport system permease subunit
MVDQEVTDILEEIRNRVRASEVPPGTLTPPTSNGDREESAPDTSFMDQALGWLSQSWGTLGMIGLVALSACAFPAARAARVDPMVVLRDQ